MKLLDQFNKFLDKEMDMDPADRTFIDILSVGTMLGALMEILPAIAAIFTIVWTGIRIYETSTVQKLVGRKEDGEEADSE